jgi:hypothetical protein
MLFNLTSVIIDTVKCTVSIVVLGDFYTVSQCAMSYFGGWKHMHKIHTQKRYIIFTQKQAYTKNIRTLHTRMHIHATHTYMYTYTHTHNKRTV